jgi:Na+/proline symporter
MEPSMPQYPSEPVAIALRQLANHLAEEPTPSAASMWWRLTLRMRREKARRAEQPLIWMTRISCAVAALTAALLAASIPTPSRRAAEIGLLSLIALVLPVALTLWGWSRSKN